MGTVRSRGDTYTAHVLVMSAISILNPPTDAAALPLLLTTDEAANVLRPSPGEPALLAPGVVTEIAIVDPLVVAVLDNWPATSVEELSDSPWVMEHEGTSAREWVNRLCRGAGFEPRVMTLSADVSLHVHLIAQGLGVGVLPRLAIGDAPSFKLIETGQARLIELSLRAGSESTPSIRAVRQALLDAH